MILFNIHYNRVFLQVIHAGAWLTAIFGQRRVSVNVMDEFRLLSFCGRLEFPARDPGVTPGSFLPSGVRRRWQEGFLIKTMCEDDFQYGSMDQCGRKSRLSVEKWDRGWQPPERARREAMKMKREHELEGVTALRLPMWSRCEGKLRTKQYFYRSRLFVLFLTSRVLLFPFRDRRGP